MVYDLVEIPVYYNPLRDPFGENLTNPEKEFSDGVKKICNSMERDEREAALFDNYTVIGLSKQLIEWEKGPYIHSPEFLRQT